MARQPLSLRPVQLREARAFIGAHHRHSRPPHAWLFGVGIERAGELVGVAVAARPVARHLDDGRTVEVVRTCVLEGERNANSTLYGAICRAAAALGYRRAITYTLEAEPGSSLLAAGFAQAADVPDGRWTTPSRPRYTTDLWGEAITPVGAKRRWERQL